MWGIFDGDRLTVQGVLSLRIVEYAYVLLQVFEQGRVSCICDPVVGYLVIESHYGCICELSWLRQRGRVVACLFLLTLLSFLHYFFEIFNILIMGLYHLISFVDHDDVPNLKWS